jgi:hypothetical protein
LKLYNEFDVLQAPALFNTALSEACRRRVRPTKTAKWRR